MRTTDKLIISTPTMRDGEQGPGASDDARGCIARALERMKVDVIEAGFPASSNGDFEAVRAIANAIKDSTVCGLCRANDRDIQRGIALKGARSWRIHTFIATSAHGKEAAHDARAGARAGEALGAIREECVSRRRVLARDGSRSDLDFLCRVLEVVIGRARAHQYPGYGGLRRARGSSAIHQTAQAEESPTPTRRSGACIATTTWAWRSPTRSPQCRSAARARSRCHQRPGRAGRQHLARGSRHGGEDAPRLLPSRRGHRYDPISFQRRGLSQITASSCSRTRRWSARTPHAWGSTRTACWRARPTRSCAPRTWAGAPTRSCSASSPAGTRSSSA